MSQSTPWQPYREPLRTTLVRTVSIALVAGAIVNRSVGGGLARWPVVSVVMLWPSFGGHWVELWFLNWLRPRMSPKRGVQLAARIVVWFVAGVGFAFAMGLTATALLDTRLPARTLWWIGGLGFIGIELVAQSALQMRGRPSVYNGRG